MTLATQCSTGRVLKDEPPAVGREQGVVALERVEVVVRRIQVHVRERPVVLVPFERPPPRRQVLAHPPCETPPVVVHAGDPAAVEEGGD